MDFYRSVRNLMREKQPRLKFVFQNAFDFSESWNSMFDDDDHENVIMDAHYYIAWSWKMDTIDDYCALYEKDMPVAQKIKYDVWVGEWSLATDVCAMWLAGFNDTGTSPQFDCNWVDCPYSYLPEEHAVDFDRTAAEIGPFGGSDVSGVKYGKCPSDSLNFTSDEIHSLAQCAYDNFDENVQGHFLWTFRNELEPRWNYVTSYDNGWTKRSAATFLQ
uniref:Glycoside hydrolase family 5 domain-containing protein n=1 Tax=Strombidinopsis acuminata TaxID=141414 RepID=A0A7S3SUH7_9SPIT|mmetsp:Transcript_44632/g.60497  ORF Transcript_44632/g.60497 Transcript_44632/m.60497 type:complete len:217 (+) Transcript_44632:397-1047(+)